MPRIYSPTIHIDGHPLSWSFSSGANSVEAFIDSANTRSVALAERLGFERCNELTGETPGYVLTRARYLNRESDREKDS